MADQQPCLDCLFHVVVDTSAPAAGAGPGAAGSPPASVLGWLFDTTPFPARWYCGQWSSALGWTHIVADLAIWLAYMAIPIALVLLVVRGRAVPMKLLFWLFAAFILSCGTTHLIEASIFWSPIYRISAIAKVITALISLTTVAFLLPALPRLMDMPAKALRHDELEREIHRRHEAEAKLQESQRRLNLAMEAGSLAWWEMDLATGDLLFGDNWATMLGYPPSQLPSNLRAVRRLCHPDDREQIAHTLRRLTQTTGSTLTLSMRLRQADGTYRWIATRGRVIQADAKHLRVLGVNIDIDAQRQAEEQRDRHRDELEVMVHAVSHDLQSPLATAQGFVGLAQESVSEGRLEDAQSEMRYVSNAVERLRLMVSGLLDHSRAGRHTQVVIGLDPDPVVTKVREVLRPMLSDKDARLEVPQTLPLIDADPIGLERVLTNLVSNALRYGCPEPGMSIRITGGVENEYAYLRVSDDGPGIDKAYQANIFHLFSRLGQDNEGVGIGLASVSKVMERHRGRVELDSDTGRGCSFVLSFPRMYTGDIDPPDPRLSLTS